MEIKMTDEQIHHFIRTLIGIYAEQNGVEIKLTWKGDKKDEKKRKKRK